VTSRGHVNAAGTRLVLSRWVRRWALGGCDAGAQRTRDHVQVAFSREACCHARAGGE
jgi:hypothetical protein